MVVMELVVDLVVLVDQVVEEEKITLEVQEQIILVQLNKDFLVVLIHQAQMDQHLVVVVEVAVLHVIQTTKALLILVALEAVAVEELVSLLEELVKEAQEVLMDLIPKMEVLVMLVI